MGEMLVEGSDATLRLDGTGQIFVRPRAGDETVHPYDWNNRGFSGDSVFACQSHLVRCLLSGLTSPISGREYLRNLVIEEAIYQSSQRGEKIDV